MKRNQMHFKRIRIINAGVSKHSLQWIVERREAHFFFWIRQHSDVRKVNDTFLLLSGKTLLYVMCKSVMIYLHTQQQFIHQNISAALILIVLYATYILLYLLLSCCVYFFYMFQSWYQLYFVSYSDCFQIYILLIDVNFRMTIFSFIMWQVLVLW